MTIYTIELQGHTGSGVETFYLADGPFNTDPADAPADTFFRPAIQTPANFERALFSSGATTGKSSIGFGEIKIVNSDGFYDRWIEYGFDGRPCIIKAIPTDPVTQKPLWRYSEAPVLLRASIDSLDITDAFSTLRLRIYDRLSDLDKALNAVSYAGTTIYGGLGAEGTADLKDTKKPNLYGSVATIQPVDVNPFDLIRQVSARPCTRIVAYDGGVSLVLAADVGSVSELQAVDIAPGQYATCLALGLIKLGGTPAYPVTVDATAVGGASAAEIAQQMLIDAGFTAQDIDAASFAALKSLNAAPCGLWVQADTTVLEAVTQVLSSIGGWIISDAFGRFQVGRLELPSVSPIALFEEWMLCGTIERLAPGDDNRGIPASKVTVRYGRLGQVLGETEIAGSVDDARRSDLKLEWRNASVEAPSVKVRHLLAQEMTFDTCLVNAADALAEATRLLAIYSVRRDVWRFSVPMTAIDYRVDKSVGEPLTLGIDLGATIQVAMDRFLNPPRNLVVIGRVEQCDKNQIQFVLWG